jgi:general stress protein YciG
MANKARTSQQNAGPSTSDTRAASEHKSASSGRGWHGDPTGHAAAGSKGGQKVSQDREHMARIGRKGGQTIAKDRQHMAEIGRKGGQSRKDTAAGEQKPADNKA